MSINFPLRRYIDDTHVRYNWVRMPLKSDFMDTLKRYERLPLSNTEEALAMKRIEKAASSEGAKSILN